MAHRVRDPINNRSALVTCHQHLAHGADKSAVPAHLGPLSHGVEPVLRVHLLGHARRAQRNTRDRPIAVTGCHRKVGIPCLVGPVERPDTQVDNTTGLRRAVIAKPRDGAIQRTQGVVRQPHSL